MPEITKKSNDKELGSAPLLSLTLWPNRSMGKRQFYSMMSVLFGAMMIPVIPFIGSKTVLLVLPFSLTTLFLLFVSVIMNYRAGRLHESITIWPNLIEVKRYEANGTDKNWSANPYWTKVKLYEESQKVENYLTLSGSGREVELGSFLAPNERLAVKQKIDVVMKEINL
jgi:uncharacterized membrane protein